MKNARYYSYETNQTTCRDAMRCYLKTNKIAYELSGCFGAYHFEILATPEQLDQINAYIDTL